MRFSRSIEVTFLMWIYFKERTDTQRVARSKAAHLLARTVNMQAMEEAAGAVTGPSDSPPPRV